jgi:hypothetical protein
VLQPRPAIGYPSLLPPPHLIAIPHKVPLNSKQGFFSHHSNPRFPKDADYGIFAGEPLGETLAADEDMQVDVGGCARPGSPLQAFAAELQSLARAGTAGEDDHGSSYSGEGSLSPNRISMLFEDDGSPLSDTMMAAVGGGADASVDVVEGIVLEEIIRDVAAEVQTDEA